MTAWESYSWESLPDGGTVTMARHEGGLGERITKKSPKGEYSVQYLLPNGKEVDTEAEFLDGLARMRP